MRTLYHTTMLFKIDSIIQDREGLTTGNPPRWNGPNDITLEHPAEHVYLFSDLFEAVRYGRKTATAHLDTYGAHLPIVVLKLRSGAPSQPAPLEQYETHNRGTWWRTKNNIGFRDIKTGWYLDDLDIGFKYDRRPIEKQIPDGAVILARKALRCVYLTDEAFYLS